MPAVSVVVLTMGDRPDELATAIASVRDQTGTQTEVVLVVNGGDPDRSLADVVVEPGRNLGIPAGRNRGAEAASGDVICFLDDDGRLIEPTLVARAVARFEAEPDLAALAMRIVDETGGTARRHLPGLRHRPDDRRDVTSFPGGAVFVRRAAFEEAGGLCDEFHYGLEETDLAWRLVDRGGRIAYDPDLVMFHPATEATRHADHTRLTARNRVWLAHRSLPAPLAVLYCLDWLAITAIRNRFSPAVLNAAVAGTREGLRRPPGPRRPIGWGTVGRLTRLGRPPIV